MDDVAGEFAAPNEAGRTGRAPAGCVFWIRGADAAFATTARDHANCSVGSLTHGFLSLEEAAQRDDVAAVLEAGWVDEAALGSLPHVEGDVDRVIYAPLETVSVAPDVVLMRIYGQGLMTLRGALPDLAIEGKPQCHIIALAKKGRAAASVGCALSRVRTGMKPEEMTVALPGARLAEIVSAIEDTAALDGAMASYAAKDSKRFVASRFEARTDETK